MTRTEGNLPLRHLFCRFLVVAVAVSSSVPLAAQQLRYELGSRLRLFERDFEASATPAERERALPALSSAVQLFFGMQLQRATQQLDAARVAVQDAAHRDLLAAAIHWRLNCPRRWIDPAEGSLACQIESLYAPTALPSEELKIAVQWQLLTGVPPAQRQPVVAGEWSAVEELPVALSLDLAQVPPGDYWLQLRVRPAVTDAEDVPAGGIAVLERMISLAPQPARRLEALEEGIARLAASQDSQPDSSQLSSLKFNVSLLRRVLDDDALETDMPAERLLRQTETGLDKLQAGQVAYGDGQPGEFWLAPLVGDSAKWLRLRAPAVAAERQPLPLVLALHGAGGSENMFFDSYGDGKIVRLCDDRGWLLAAPRAGLGYTGYQLDDLVDAIDQLYPVDRNALFIVGHSMGAGGATALTGAARGKPTAVAALGGGRGVRDAVNYQGVSFFVAAGSHDFGRPGAMQLAASLKAGGVETHYRDYENVEHLAIVQVALDDVFQFFDSLAPAPNSPDAPSAPADLRINQLQLVGTHNSYHLAPDEIAMKTITAVVPREAESIDNSQRPLTEQFAELGVRHIELDLFLDPDGKLFSKPMAYAQAVRQGSEVPPFDPDGKMTQPGIKVLHSPDFDFRTTTYTLVDALTEIKAWSDAHPTHVPIFVLLELKSASFSPLTRPLPWTLEGYDELEREILSVFPRERILAPDDVRAGAATLRDAVVGRGWPTVDSQRGKVAFLLDNEGAVRDLYLSRSEILEGRLLFTSVSRDHPAAAWMKRNEAIRSFDEIVSLVEDGFLVRTRADVGTVEARRNSTRRRDRAIASGAQLISTDFPEPDQRFSDYHVSLPLPHEP